jgi:hypothetical protein
VIHNHSFAISPRIPREFCFELPSLEKRGSGECRMHAAPAVSCAKVVRRNAHEHTGSAEALRHSLRNGFTAYAVLSPATNSSCHRRCRLDGGIGSGRVDLATGSLAPATGARTTRFCRTHQRRSSCAPVDRSRETRPATPFRADAAASTASHPNVRDDGQRPSLKDRTARLLELICPTCQAEYFCRRHWTEQKRDLPVRQHKRLWVDARQFSGIQRGTMPARPAFSLRPQRRHP